jgi:hypothetical protein
MDEKENGNIYIAYDKAFSRNKFGLAFAVNWLYPNGPDYFLTEMEAQLWVIDSGFEATHSKVYILKLSEEISLQVMLSNNTRNTLSQIITASKLEQLYHEQYRRK